MWKDEAKLQLSYSESVDEFVNKEKSKQTKIRHYRPGDNVQPAHWPDVSGAEQQSKYRKMVL